MKQYRSKLFVAFLAIISCGNAGSQEQTKALSHPNGIVLVTMDTIRTDHLSTYGYIRETSPFIDSLADKGVRFENAFATTPHTGPAHLSIFSGAQVSQHKNYNNTFHEVPHNLRLMTEQLSDAGYRTGAVTAVTFLSNLSKGFDHFDAPTFEAGSELAYRPADEVVKHAKTFLDSVKPGEKYFLWLHFFDCHWPLSPPDSLVERFHWTDRNHLISLVDQWVNTEKISLMVSTYRNDDLRANMINLAMTMNSYDAEIAYVDSSLKEVEQYLGSKGLDEQLLWVITGDHGEGLGTHNWYGHNRYLYNEAVRVPLIFSSDAWALSDVAPPVAPVSQVDIPRTIGELAGFDFEQPFLEIKGQSLVPLITGSEKSTPREYAFIERIPIDPKIGDSKNWPDKVMTAITDGRFKYIYRSDSEDEFYDMDSDPYEQENLIGQDSKKRDEMAAYVAEYLASLLKDSEDIDATTDSDSHREELEALGYL